jgi:hypothetical protein
MNAFSQFERWALCCAVPALGLPELHSPTEEDLRQRAFDISYDLCPQTEKELAQNLINLGALDYLDPAHAPEKVGG